MVIADHIVFPVTIKSKYPYTVSGAFPGQGDGLEQLSLMAFIAGKTRALRLISSVMILPHRNPVVTAKMQREPRGEPRAHGALRPLVRQTAGV